MHPCRTRQAADVLRASEREVQDHVNQMAELQMQLQAEGAKVRKAITKVSQSRTACMPNDQT